MADLMSTWYLTFVIFKIEFYFKNIVHKRLRFFRFQTLKNNFNMIIKLKELFWNSVKLTVVPTECQVNNLRVKYQDELLCQTLLHSFYHIDCNNLSVICQYEWLCRTLLYNCILYLIENILLKSDTTALHCKI